MTHILYIGKDSSTLEPQLLWNVMYGNEKQGCIEIDT